MRMEFIDQGEDRALIHAPHGPELVLAQLRARECRATMIHERDSLQLRIRTEARRVSELLAFQRAEPRIVRKSFATRKGWKAHHMTLRAAIKKEIRRITEEIIR